VSGDGREAGLQVRLQVGLPDVTDLVLGDPWLTEAYTLVKADPARNPRVLVLRFDVGPGTDPGAAGRAPESIPSVGGRRLH
jgi:hypothetical protein